MSKLARLSAEMRCRCAREDEIVDPDAPTGTIHDCPTCGTSYMNVRGVWRNTLTLSLAERRRYHASTIVARIRGRG